MKELIERLRLRAQVKSDAYSAPKADTFEWDVANTLEQQASRIAELETLCEKLKLEAQIHAQEARTANATIAEIYQVVTGRTGEPGNWNGAEPVKKRIVELEAQKAELLGVIALALKYWADRQQRYKNRRPIWVQRAMVAVSNVKGGTA